MLHSHRHSLAAMSVVPLPAVYVAISSSEQTSETSSTKERDTSYLSENLSGYGKANAAKDGRRERQVPRVKALLILACLVLTLGCVSKSDYEVLQTQNEVLEERIESDSQNFAAEIASKDTIINDLQNLKGSLEAELETSKEETSLLSSKLTTKETELVTANRDIDRLSDEQTQLNTEIEEWRRLEGSRGLLKSQVERLETQLGTLEAREKRQQETLTKLREEIAELISQKAIIPKPVKDGVECTGSMEPAITCLDRVSFLEIGPETDLTVGNVVTFPDPDGDDYSILHRIIAISEQSGEIFYLTKGDNAFFTDEEWLHREDLLEVVTAIEKDAFTDDEELKALREKVNSLTAAYKKAWGLNCASIVYTGGKCTVSEVDNDTIQDYHRLVDCHIDNYYSPFKRLCFGSLTPPCFSWYESCTVYEYTLEPSVLCNPLGNLVGATWRGISCS